MNEFRDAIAAARVWMPGVDAQDYHCGVDMADEILAMPEMRAIRAALRIEAFAEGQSSGMGRTRWLREVMNLPDSVIEWVLS